MAKFINYDGADAITLKVKLNDDLEPRLVALNSDGTEREATDDTNPKVKSSTYVVDTTSSESDAESETVKVAVRKNSDDGWSSLKVQSGEKTWSGHEKSFTLKSGSQVLDVEFTVELTRPASKGTPDPSKAPGGWTSSTSDDGTTVTWTLDPYLRFQRKGYNIQNPS